MRLDNLQILKKKLPFKTPTFNKFFGFVRIRIRFCLRLFCLCYYNFALMNLRRAKSVVNQILVCLQAHLYYLHHRVSVRCYLISRMTFT